MLARPRRLVLHLIAGLLAAGAALPMSAAPAPNDDDLSARLERLTAELETQRERMHIPGMAIAIVKDDEIIYARGFGVTDLDTGAPATEETIFAVGSTTKAFTAALVGMLVDDGAMGWDDPVRTHIPYYRLKDAAADEQVVIRDLLCHRIGFASMNMLWFGNDLGPEEVLGASLNAELLHPFRQKWNYSNISFLAAGVAAGNASGSDWHALLEQRILRPLGMSVSSSTYEAAISDPMLSKGYLWDDDTGAHVHQPMRSVDGVAPAGSINSNVRDMARWVRFQLGHGVYDGTRLLSDEQHAQMWTPHSTVGGDIGYGLGWFLRDWHGKRVIEHAGGIDGFTAEVAMLPDENVGFVLLMNRFAAPLQDASREIVFDALLGAAPDAVAAAGATAEDLSPYVGAYIANFGPFDDAEMEVLVQGDTLAIDIPGQMVFELREPDEDGKRPFVMTDQIAVRFNRADDGGVRSLTIFQAGMEFEVPREGVALAGGGVDERTVAPYLGKYHFAELGVDAEVLVHNGHLAVDIPGQMTFELKEPDDEGRRHLKAMPAVWVRFEEGDDGRVAALTMMQNGVAMTLEPVADPQRDAVPSAAALMAKVHAALGAAHADRLDEFRTVGTIRFVHMGIQGTIRNASAGVRSLVDIDLGEFGRIRTAYDGERAFLDSSFMGIQEMKGEAREEMRRSHPLGLLDDWTAEYEVVHVVGAEERDGRPVWAITLDPAGGPAMTLYVDQGSFLPVEVEASPLSVMGMRVPTTTRLDDYRSVEGVMIPFRVVSRNDMTGSLEITLEHAEPAPVAPGTFTLSDGG